MGDNGFEADGLIRTSGRTTALDGVSLPTSSRARAETAGPDGAGKTTVSTDTLPGGPGARADVNPVTPVMDACRALPNGTPDDGSTGRTLLWPAVLFVVFCPLAVRAHGRQE